MRRSTFALCFTVLSLPIAATSLAGYASAPGVTITEPYGSYDSRMTGSLLGARDAPNDVEYIRCGEGACIMRDANWKTRGCYVLDEALVSKMESVGPASYVELYRIDTGLLGAYCSVVKVYNGSQYLP